MSGINTPFPVDSVVLGKVVSFILHPSDHPPDCFAQGLLKADGTLDPSVPSQVVKFVGLGSAQLKVIALHGNFSRGGVMSSPVHPAVALSATFNEGRVSNAVFGTIKPVNNDNKYIRALAGIHATFGLFPEAQLLHQPKQARWGCTEVVIGRTGWSTGWGGSKTASVEPLFHESSRFFRHDFTTNETYVEFMATANVPHRCPSGRFGSTDEFDPGVSSSFYKTTITPDGTISVNHVFGPVVKPSETELNQAEKMFRECHALLQSNIGVIKWLEDHHVQPAHEVKAVFNWMNGFQSAIMPRPSIFGPALMPGMIGTVWKRLMQIDPNGLSAAAAASNRVIQPCACTPTRKNPMCNNRFCPFKHSGLILAQSAHKQPVSSRFETRAQIEAKKASFNPRGLQALKKSLKDDARIERRERERTAAAASAAAASLASPPVSEPKPASASASAPVSSASVKSTVTKPDSKKKGGKTRKRRHRGL